MGMVGKPLETYWCKMQGPEQVILEQQTQGGKVEGKGIPAGSH